VYGEYQNLGDPYRNVIGIFMNQIMQGRPMTIFGDGTQQRAFSYVGDIVPAIAESPWVPAAACQVFNIGAETPYTVNELASAVAAAMGRADHPVEHLPSRHEVHTAYSDHSKAQQVFGTGSATSLETGLLRMADWAKRGGVRASRPFQGVEIARNLPERWRALVGSSVGDA
jgi:UDP-glucose 4-epimerase